MDCYGYLIPGGNKQAVDRFDTPPAPSAFHAESATPAQPIREAARMHERKSSLDHAVMARRNGVSDGFRTSPRCCNVVIQHGTAEHTMQRRTVTSQCLKRFVRSNSIARLGVPLCTVSPLIPPEVVTQAVTPAGQKSAFSSCLAERPSRHVRQARGLFWDPTPRHLHAIEPRIETSDQVLGFAHALLALFRPKVSSVY